LFPIGIIRCCGKEHQVNLTTEEIGKIVRATRRKLGVTQADLALTSGTGLRFIVDLEKGKQTCHVGKVLTVLQTLGIRMSLEPPPAVAPVPDEER